MKILHVITGFSAIGGAEMMLCRLIKSIPKEEHHLISLMHINNEIFNDTLKYCESYKALGWNGINTLKVISNLKESIKSINPDIIQCWMYHANVITTLSIIGLNKKPKLFWGVHHSLASPKEESLSTKVALILSRYLSNQPHGIIYCANSSKNQHQKYGFKNHNSIVIPNGIFLDQFQLNSKLHEPLTIGFAGRYHTAKGYPYLFKTIDLLKDQNIIFKIAGSGASLNNPKVKALFEKYQLDDNKVHLLDQVSNMSEFYQSIDAFLMTSITEGFPNVLVEAMASGLPCFSTDVGDASYIIDNPNYVVKPRDTKSLEKVILQYKNLDSNEKLALKTSVRNRVERNFSINKVSAEYTNFWKN